MTKAETSSSAVLGVEPSPTASPHALADRVETSAALPDVNAKYLIRKHGAWYRPRGEGYTSSAISAGRWSLEEAEHLTHPNGRDGPRDGLSFIREDEVDCDDWRAFSALSQRIAELERELVGHDLPQRIAELEGALQWYADPSTWFGSYCGGTAPMNDDVSYVGGEITQGKRARAALKGGTDAE